MNIHQINELAQYLYDAELNRKAIPKLTETVAVDLTAETAYQVQAALIELKIADGHQIIAPKLGLTSKAKMAQMQVERPIVGYVFDNMKFENNGDIVVDTFIHPRVEPEITVIFKQDMETVPVSQAQLVNNIDYIVSAVEIIDSRFIDYEFTYADVIADNTSAKGYVMSDGKVTIDKLDLLEETAVLSINNQEVQRGKGSDVYGSPIEALMFLIEHTVSKGKVVKASEPIMTGGMTQSVAISSGDTIEVKFSTLETIQFNVK